MNAMKTREITPRWLLGKVADILEMELQPKDKTIVLLSKSKKSLTVTQTKGNAIVKRWRIHVVEEE